MLAISPSSRRNRLLAALSEADFGLLQPHLRPVTLKAGYVLEHANKRIDDAYFLDAGIASVVAVQGKESIEIGLIGPEGVSGTAIVLANDRSPHFTYMQVAGGAQRIASAEFRKAIRASNTLQRVMLSYVQAFSVQTAHAAIASARGKLDERLARWILMAHDRVGGDTVMLTHEFLALRLGVRRAGVTEALHALQKQKLIRIGRGRIILLDREGIEQRAGHFYGVPEAEYRRLIG
jgi:CRP-like cAMP-binding protein